MKYYQIFFAIFWVFIYCNLLFYQGLREFIILTSLANSSLTPILIIIGQVIFSILILPCSIFSLLSGMIWGFELGTIYSLMGTLISSSVTFLIGIYLHSNWLYKKNNVAIKKIFALINKYNWKAAFIAYLNPVFPGSSLGFLFGASSLRFRFFILGATLGTLPFLMLLVLSGSVVDNFYNLIKSLMLRTSE